MPVSLTRSRTLLSRRRLRSPRDGLGVHSDVAGVDGQRAAAGHGVAGVDREIHQHLLQLARVGQDRLQVTGERGDQLDVLAEGPAQHFLHRGDDGVEVEDLGPHHLPAGEGEQLAGEAGRPFAGPADLPEVVAGRLAAPGPVRFGRGGEFLGGEGRVVEDHREEVVEVVRDPAGQLAQALQALGLRQLFLRLVLPPPVLHDVSFASRVK